MQEKWMFLWGIMIYGLSLTTWSVFYRFEIDGSLIAVIGGYVVLAIASYTGGRFLRATSFFDIFPYSLVWALTIALMEWILSLSYVGDIAALFNPVLLVGYAVVALVPLFALYPHFGRGTSPL